MKKYLIFLLLIGLKLTVSAQKIPKFHSELERIDTSKVVIKCKYNDSKSKGDCPRIIITDVKYHKHAKRYFVYGCIKDLGESLDSFKGLVYGIYIWNTTYNVLVYTTTTTDMGLFAISLDKGQVATFNTTVSTDLYIKN